MRIVFAGTPEFASEHLKCLIEAGFNVVAAYTQPDRPAGRGRKVQVSDVKAVAQEYNIPVEQPVNFKHEDELETLKSYAADLMIVVAYGIILPVSVLETPVYGCLNVHGSILPRWRGAAPYHRAILSGDKQTGVTIMQMDKGLDTGDMLVKHYCDITAEDNASTLHDKLIIVGKSALLESLTQLQKGELTPEKQDESLANYAHKLTKEEGKINWLQSNEAVLTHVRGLNPWPVAYTFIQDLPIRIWETKPAASIFSKKGVAGEIIAIKPSLIVATQDGVVEIITLQAAGSKAMLASDFINGKGQWMQIGMNFVS
ncbi:MAG: methionyl-tRNA formyltransferase [Saccharospirillaceae bacterium]|nr:methionyl-tRNA formyltransferase [Pseudomonadales bacterium]NRB78823.1 methionyl-tRNA formyltransferase [Saccharospirillaceae bacterium]